MRVYREYHAYQHTGGWESASKIIGKVIKRANKNDLNLHIEYNVNPDEKYNEGYLEFSQDFAHAGDYIVQDSEGNVKIWSEEEFKKNFVTDDIVVLD